MFLIQANVIHRGSRPARLTSESTATQTRGEGMEGTMAYLPARWLLIAAAVLALLASPASALTTYYVDPDFGGTQTGATSNPWTSLTTSAWATINGRLASDNVTVYFSARKASSDTNQTSTVQIDLNKRSDTSTHTLTLDGMSFYNSNVATPSWVAYSGSSKFQITTSVPIQRDGTPRCLNNITINGFRLITTSSQIANLTYIKNLIFKNNEGSAAVGSAGGPGVYVGPANDGPGCGGNGPDHVQVLNNNIHDTFGECLYIGASTADPPGGGGAVNTGDDYLIQGNTLTNCGIRGGQGDGIDVKDGHTNLRIINNTLRWPNIGQYGCDCSAIILESGDLVDGNYIEAPQKNGIYSGAGWDNTVGRNALIIRNNVVVNITAGPGHRNGIELEGASSATYQWSNTRVYNNSIYKTVDACVEIGAPQGPVTVTNNIFQECGGNGVSNAAAAILTTHDYNQYFNIAGSALANAGVSTSCANIATVEPRSMCGDPKFVSTSPPYAATNFKLQATSPVLARGAVIGSFTTDYYGNLRGLSWDKGAIQLTGVGSVGIPPGPPSNLVVQ